MRLFTFNDSDIKKTGQITYKYFEEVMAQLGKNLIVFVVGVGLFFCSLSSSASGVFPPEPLAFQQTVQDTLPLEDRYGNYISDDKYNPFDLFPSNIDQSVEYDPESGTYLVTEKIGDEYYRAPSYLTFEEYLEWRSKQQEREYFDKISGISSEYSSGSALVDPLSRVNIERNLIDRLFGGNDITIEPQGSIDLTFGVTHSNTEAIDQFESARKFTLFDFDMDIKMNVEGNIGDKMNLGFNFDNNASFDFDRKIKLEYDSEQFSEDDIIKKIEAGNVSLPLRSTLIQGNQSLFGLKTELQFGRLRITGIASQQRSRQESLSVQNGATFQEFELRPDEYDENRHFFISHYHRGAYEEALSNMPYINNSFRVTNIEVWISDNRPDYQQNQTLICGITDLAEPNEALFSNDNPLRGYEVPLMPDPNLIDIEGRLMPENDANTLMKQLIDDPLVNRGDRTRTVLESSEYGMEYLEDFEIFTGRKLNPSEYTFNAELGFISLNARLRQDQVLAVSYEYFYTLNCDNVYKVGLTTDEGSVPNNDSRGEVQPEGVIFAKLIKGSRQTVNHPTWDLMMKNVYPLRTNQLNEADFTFNIFYEDDSDGSLKNFLPEPNFPQIPLLNVFQLDRLNSRNDPQPDGVFDFVPGITVIPQSGSIIFPVLEPFGSSLDSLFGDPAIAAKYKYQELYDTTVVIAAINLVQNKFVMKGRYKSTISSEYSLGAWNIPQGSVTVRAGGRILTEGIDYEVDYGIGRVRIINEAFLQQGTPINVSYEDNSVFSLQQRTMLGMRAEYEVNENFYIGGTYMRLFERPFTQKVNIGDDPINNRVFGLDMDYSKEAPWVTKLVDKLPFYSTNAESNINFTAEVAALKPGHSGAVNLNGSDDNGGVVSIDDFEGAVSSLPLSSQPNRWALASVPDTEDFPEYNETGLAYGANRALLNWYVIDRSARRNTIDADNSYTRFINQQELFNRQLPQGQLPDLFTFDLSYYPDERGPYNFDPPNGIPGISAGIDSYDPVEDRLVMADPESRWAGIMRYMPNSDFQAANYEFIEFWLLNPFMDRPDGTGHDADETGFITFHLGNVSEDILKDNLQFFENSLPTPGETPAITETVWGDVPKGRPTNDAFDNEFRADQDLGLDGLDTLRERIKFQDYLDDVAQAVGLPQKLFNDPSGDQFYYFNDFSATSPLREEDDLLKRYKYFNNPEGNSPDLRNIDQFQRGNPNPDKEDLNNNRSLDPGESFHQYKVPINNLNGEIDTLNSKFIREVRPVTNPQTGATEKWYRYRIPLNEGEAINGIEGFRSIQFMRIIVNGYRNPKTFRMADFELIRNQWRRLPGVCNVDGVFTGEFNVDVVGVEENQTKDPFGYTLPRGIQQERLFSNFANVLQDERSLSMNFCELEKNCNVSIVKLTDLDLRVFERMQMFVHAESRNDEMEDGDVSIFLRVGKDFDLHYYEYEIPLTLSRVDSLLTDRELSDIVWPEANMFDFPLDIFIQAKKMRNVLGVQKLENFEIDNAWLLENLPALEAEYQSISVDTIGVNQYLPEGHKVTIKGNPNLGLVKGIQIGLRNRTERDDAPAEGFCGEVWVNELRVTGLLERGGLAGLARLDVQMADLGNVSASTSYSSLGWGALDQRVNERAKEEVIEYDVATNLELGKFFPDHWGLRIPFYAQYAKSITNPEFDAYDFDITVEDEFDIVKNMAPEVADTISQRNQTVRTIRTFNFTNVRKERTGGKKQDKPDLKAASKNAAPASAPKPATPQKPRKPKPWDVENISLSYAFTEIKYRDPILKADNSKDYRLGIDYSYNRRGGYIQPFKKLVKAKSLALIKEINFNPIPNSLTFSSDINRFIATRTFRIPDDPSFEFEDRRFIWERRYDMNWNLTKSIKINYSAFNEAYIDELRQVGVAANPDDRPWVDEFGNEVDVSSDPGIVRDYWQDNIRDFGRNTNFNQNVSVNYTLPMKYIPYMDWIDVRAQYRGVYNWAAGPLITIDDAGNSIGSIIQNQQNRSITANFNLDKLYNKSKYIKSLDKRQSNSRSRRGRLPNDQQNKVGRDDDQTSKNPRDSRDSRNKDKEAGTLAKLLLRPLFALRSVKINYKEDFSTTVPGFMGVPQYFGLSDGFSSPGVGFVMGLQPDISITNPNNWLQQAASNDWITKSRGLNQEVIQTERQDIDVKIKVEPWADFRIDIDLQKTYQTNHSEEFKNKSLDPDIDNYQQLALRDVGSFEMTFFSLGTLFDGDLQGMFSRFEDYRSIISYRLPNNIPDSHTEDGVEYANGYGKQSSTVVVPAFLAAYTGADPNTISLDLENDVRSLGFIPKPNWKMRYDGLVKLPWFSDRFSSFTIEHGYSSRLRVNSFFSDVQYDANDPYDELKANGNYYSRLEIPFIQINEQFNPVIGVNMKTKKDLNLEFSYVKGRTLDLSINASSELQETRRTEYVFGFGYTIRDSKFLKKKNKRRSSRSRNTNEDDATANNPRRSSRRNVTSQRGNDMTFLLNFGYSDNISLVHQLDFGGSPEPSRGTKTLSINPSIDYVVNENLTMRLFVDYRSTRPYISSSPPVTTINGGITMQMTLN